MGVGRDERYSEYLLRKQPIESKLGEAALNIDKIFAGESELTITISARGELRVRADIPDEDAYMAYIENSSFVGLAQAAGSALVRYVAERHFPHKHHAGKPTYQWEFTPATNELTVKRYETAREDRVLDMPIPADNEHAGYFLQLTRELLHGWRGNDYENRFGSTNYAFDLTELQ